MFSIDLWSDPNDWQIMASFNLMFDETEDNNHAVFAGLLGTPDEWKKINHKWSSVLRPYGISFFHAFDAAHRNGPYAQFRESGKEKALRDVIVSLATIACEYARGGTASEVTLKDYRKLSDKIKKQYRNPLYAAFHAGVKSLVEGKDIAPDDRFTLICDDSDAHSEPCLKIYRKLVKDAIDIREKIGGICFLDDKIYPPLQAADMFAFSFRRSLSFPDEDTVWSEVWKLFLSRFNESQPILTILA